jgi:predicted MFS family arabinose efflux permease
MAVRTRTGRIRVLLAFGCFGLFWGAWGAILPAVRADARADDADLGIALLMIGVGALLSMRLTGVAVDRFGPRVMPLTVAAFGLAGVLPAVAESPVQLGGVLFLLGAASGAMDVAINTAGSAEEARSGPLMNLAHAAFSAAVLTGSLATAGARAAGAGPAPVLGAVAALVLAGAVWAARTAPADPGPARTGVVDREPGRSWVPVVLGLLCALAYVVENAWQSWSAVHLESTLGAGPGLAGLGPAVFAACTTIGRLAGQRLAHRRTDRQMLAGGALLAAVGSAVAATAGSIPAALGGLAVAGLGTAVCAPTILGVAGRWARAGRRASAIATVTTLAYVGFLVGPAAVGLLSAATDLRGALVAVAGVAVLLTLLTSAVPRVPRATGQDRRGVRGGLA